MEQRIWSNCKATILSNSSNNHHNLEALASTHSLITNPSTTEPTITSIFQTLTLTLTSNPNSNHSTTINLLSTLSSHHPHLSTPTSHSLLHLLNPNHHPTRTIADSLAALFSISATNFDTEALLMRLSFDPRVSIRLWVLKNAEKFGVGSCLLRTVLLGFTKDPYPLVRKAALDGLAISVEADNGGDGLIAASFFAALELLRDVNHCLRAAAITLVSRWGQMLEATNKEEDRRDWLDFVFVQICSMVRDMSVEVRIKAFDALGKIETVSEDILLQTLSKKVLGITKQKKAIGRCTDKEFELLVLNVAGAFVHGLEDEFYEVRLSACHSLRKFTAFSEHFAGEALNLLVYLLNDDSMFVRLQAVETMHHMATCDHLKTQEMHLDMLLGTLVDSNSSIRSSARKIFKLLKLPSSKMFESSVSGLLENLQVYSQDETDVFSSLFHIGRSHGNFAAGYVNHFVHELEPSCEGKLALDNARVAALLVVALSASLSPKQKRVCSIPAKLFSYAVTFLGRISHGLSDVMDQNTLLSYLSHASRTTISSASVGMALLPRCNESLELHEEVKDPVDFILSIVKNIWRLLQSGRTGELLQTLRVLKEELKTLRTDSLGSDGPFAFTLHYLQVLKLLAKVWDHFFPKRLGKGNGYGLLDLHLGKLETSLREMRYRFLGLSKETESHVLELLLVTYLMMLSENAFCFHHTTSRKLSSIISQLELSQNEPSTFVIQVKKLCSETDVSMCVWSDPLLLNKLLGFFFLKQPQLFGSQLNHLNAKLNVPGNDSENPLLYISGLPVGIPFEIVLYNISSENRLWVTMSIDEKRTQFLYLDLNQFGCSNGVRKFTFLAAFYYTRLKAAYFTLKACIGMECYTDEIYRRRDRGVGPSHELISLCEEKQVYLSMLDRN